MSCFGRKKTVEDSSTQCDIPNFDVCRGRFFKDDNPGNQAANYKQDREKNVYRHVFLVRHGNYQCKVGGSSSDSLDDQNQSQGTRGNTGSGSAGEDSGCLTDLGRKQTEATGRRLKSLLINYGSIISSDMARTKETAQIIATEVDFKKDVQVDAVLNEGALPQMTAAMQKYNASELEDYWSNFPAKDRFEQAFRKYFRKPTSNVDTFEIVVCHCNIIKFFVHKIITISLPKLCIAWFPSHGSITIVSINVTGQFFLRTLGDCGHMERGNITVNNVISEVFWNSWLEQTGENENLAKHACVEESFTPHLCPFNAMVWKNSTADPRQVPWIRFNFDEYCDFTKAIVHRVRTAEKGELSFSDLKTWCEENPALLKKLQGGNKESAVLYMLNRLVEMDFVLTFRDDDDSPYQDPFVRVHPNFDID